MNPTEHPRRTAPWLLAAVLGALPGIASAAFITFGNEVDFRAAVRLAGTDGFDDLSPGSTTAAPLQRQAGRYAYGVAVEPDLRFVGVGSPVPPGLIYAAGNSGDAWLSTNSATDTLRLTDLQGVGAIGGRFFGSDVNGAYLAGQLLLEALDGTGTVRFTLDPASADGFFGLVSDSPLQSLSISAVQPASGDLWVSVNDLVLANPVPEPDSLALLLAGLAGAAACTRTRGKGRDPDAATQA